MTGVLQSLLTNPLGQQDRRLLGQAENEPSMVLDDAGFRRPELALAWFEICDNLALTDPGRSVEYGTIAVELARRLGDRHLSNLARGVQAHTLLAAQEFVRTGGLLSSYEDDALGCCPACRSDWLRRMGDFMGEVRDARRSLFLLESAEKELDCEIDGTPSIVPLRGNLLGRIRFVRSVAYHWRGARDRALADVGVTLENLPMDAPRGYFDDSVAFLAVFLSKDDPSSDVTSLEILRRFRGRLKDLKGWADTWSLIRWVEGHLLARSGELVKSSRRLESTQKRALVHGRAREAAASTVDVAQLLARRVHEANIRAAERTIAGCLCQRDDLPENLRLGLEEMQTVLARHPEDAFKALGEFRASFIVSVPGLLSVLPRLDFQEVWNRHLVGAEDEAASEDLEE